ncbi:MAG: LysR family transcriptional regulator [Pusillimonas sp.]
MNIKQIEAFLVIVREGSFAAAADRLSVTQSTISARILELEQELEIALFDRSKRQIQLTYQGRDFVRYAERATNAFSDIKRRFRVADPLSGVVRVGVAELIAVTWLSSLTTLVRARYPAVTLQFDVSLNPELLAGLRGGSLDIALMAYPSDTAGLDITSLGYADFAWMGAGRAEFPSHVLSPVELARYGIVFQGVDSYTTRLMRSWLGTVDIAQPSICNSMSAIAALTEAGVGVSLLARDYHADAIAAGRLQVLDTDPPAPSVEFFAVHEVRHETSELLTVIKQLCLEATSYKQLER